MPGSYTPPQLAGGGGVGDRFSGRCDQAAKAAQAGGQFTFVADNAFEASGDSITVNGAGRLQVVEGLYAMALQVEFLSGDSGDADAIKAEISTDNAEAWGPSNLAPVTANFPSPKCTVSGSWWVADDDVLSFVGRHDASTDLALRAVVFVIRIA